MHPTALHCTSTLGDIICRINGLRPPSETISTLFSAVHSQFMRGMCEILKVVLFTARFPSAALAAL
jgi:hypothetical protein